MVPDGGLTRINVKQAGVVEAIFVRPGEDVKPGQPIMRVRASTSLPEGNAADLTAAEMRNESNALSAERQASRAQFSAQRTALVTRMGLAEDRRLEQEGRISLLEEQLKIARAASTRAQDLHARGWASLQYVDAAKLASLNASAQLSDARKVRLDIADQIAGFNEELARLAAEEASTAAKSQGEGAALAQRRLALRATATEVILAPRPGRVMEVLLRTGEAVGAGAVTAIVGSPTPPEYAELFLPSSAIGRIKAGQDVRLKLDAFPFERYGTLKAQVTEISGTILSPAEISAPGLQLKEPVFRVRARIISTPMALRRESSGMHAGMTLSASIVVDRLSFFEWLFRPLPKARGA
jgi:membrane fusion protein